MVNTKQIMQGTLVYTVVEKKNGIAKPWPSYVLSECFLVIYWNLLTRWQDKSVFCVFPHIQKITHGPGSARLLEKGLEFNSISPGEFPLSWQVYNLVLSLKCPMISPAFQNTCLQGLRLQGPIIWISHPGSGGKLNKMHKDKKKNLN